MSTDAIRKARARKIKQAAGLTEVRVWLDEKQNNTVSMWSEEARVSKAAAVASAVNYTMWAKGL